MSNDIGSFFSGAIQSIEQNVESGVENMFSGKSGSSGSSTAGGAQGSNSLGGFDIGALFGSGNNGIGALFGSGSNGLFGELFAKLGGSELGIIGNLFQGNTNKSQQGNGYAPPPAGNGGTIVPPPPPGNTGTGGAVGPCGSTLPPGFGTTTGTTGTQPATSTADPRMNDAIASLETLMMNFSKCSSNGQMTPASLQQAAWDPSNPSLQQAAKFFTSNPDLMRDLFVKGGGSSASFDQLNSLDSMWTQMQKSTGSTGGVGSTGTTPRLDPTKLISGVLGSTGTNTTGVGATGTGGTNYSDLIAQLEQQIAQLQQQLNAMGTGSLGPSQPASINPNITTGGVGDLTTTANTGGTAQSISKLDDGIAGYQGDIEQQMKILSDPKSTDGQKQAAQSQIQLDTMHMQQEMDALKQLFEMLSNMEKAYSDICMNAISNMR